jgi:GNAT superfamily N-acetyltransferase
LSVRLRTAEAADVDAMLAIVEAGDLSHRDWAPAGWRPPPPGSARWVKEFAAPERWTAVAVDGEQVCGFVSWDPARDSAGTAHVGALFVHPDAWRRGIATTLLDAAVDAMRSRGLERARLNTLEGSPAESFYRARGWERDGRRDAFHLLMRLPAVGYARTL